jgi:hypothetical protein
MRVDEDKKRQERMTECASLPSSCAKCPDVTDRPPAFALCKEGQCTKRVLPYPPKPQTCAAASDCTLSSASLGACCDSICGKSSLHNDDVAAHAKYRAQHCKGIQCGLPPGMQMGGCRRADYQVRCVDGVCRAFEAK